MQVASRRETATSTDRREAIMHRTHLFSRFNPTDAAAPAACTTTARTVTVPGRSSRLIRGLFATLVALGLLAHGSTGAQAQRASFTGGVDMVPLTVTVTDPAGKYVTHLVRDDFQVFEDGVEQPLSFFASDDVPLDLALMLDTSDSMRTDLPLVQTAALGLVGKLRAIDRGAVVEIKGRTGIPQPLTEDHAAVASAIRKVVTSGDSAVYDGLYVVLKEFERERKVTPQVRRQVLVMLSDGLDNSSHVAFEDVLDLARRTGVNIYVISLRDEVLSMASTTWNDAVQKATYSMGTVARESGGRAFFPKSPRELSGIYNAIAQELASQYELGYMPVRPGGDGAFRRVMVRVPPSKEALARTRSGYFAARQQASWR
jgi:Ca-activated chloride channel family protein